MNHSRFHSACFLFLSTCLVFPSIVRAQEVSPELLQMALDAYRQQQEERQDPEILPAIKVDPKLVGKKVVVLDRRGRHHRGELLEVGKVALSLAVAGDVVKIPIAEVASIKPDKKMKARDWFYLTALAAIVTFIVIVVAEARGEG